MKKIELIQSIKQQDPILANAVSKMVDYIQDKWAAPYPSKEQTEAVNDYLRSVHADGDETMNETAMRRNFCVLSRRRSPSSLINTEMTAVPPSDMMNTICLRRI